MCACYPLNSCVAKMTHCDKNRTKCDSKHSKLPLHMAELIPSLRLQSSNRNGNLDLKGGKKSLNDKDMSLRVQRAGAPGCMVCIKKGIQECVGDKNKPQYQARGHDGTCGNGGLRYGAGNVCRWYRSGWPDFFQHSACQLLYLAQDPVRCQGASADIVSALGSRGAGKCASHRAQRDQSRYNGRPQGRRGASGYKQSPAVGYPLRAPLLCEAERIYWDFGFIDNFQRERKRRIPQTPDNHRQMAGCAS